MRTPNAIRTFAEHSAIITSISISPNKVMVGSASDDGIIKLWSLISEKEVKTISASQNPITCVDFNPCKRLIASASLDKKIRLWNLDTMDIHFETPIDVSVTRKIIFHNQELLFSATNESMKCWNIDYRKILDTKDIY